MRQGAARRPLPIIASRFFGPQKWKQVATKRERGKGGGWKGRRQLTTTTSRAPVNEPLFKRGEQVLLVSWHPEDRWHGLTHPSWKRIPTPRPVCHSSVENQAPGLHPWQPTPAPGRRPFQEPLPAASVVRGPCEGIPSENPASPEDPPASILWNTLFSLLVS